MDPIADMITRLRNAALAGQTSVTMPYSELKWAVAQCLAKAGYLQAVEKRGKKIKKTLAVELVYQGGRPRLTGVVRVSKSSRRIYHRRAEVWPVRQGHGLAIYSTSAGIMTDRQARAAKLGGEVLFKVW